MSKLWLTTQEVIELTGRVRPAAQIKQLKSLGYEVRHRADGTFVVPTFQFQISVQGQINQQQSILDLGALN